MFYVYVYFDQTKSSDLHSCGFSPFYVGKGKEDRAYHHLFESNIRGDNNKHKTNTIQKLLNLGIKPHIEIIANNLHEDEAYDLEISLIKLWGRSDLGLGPLTNMTDGGEGTSNKVYTDEYRQKLSDSTSKAFKEGKLKVSDSFKYSRLGIKESEEATQKRISSRSNYCHSEETKQKLKKSRAKYLNELDDRSVLATMRGKKHTEEAIMKNIMNNPKTKPVEVFGIQYLSLNQASKTTGITRQRLRKEPSFKFVE